MLPQLEAVEKFANLAGSANVPDAGLMARNGP